MNRYASTYPARILTGITRLVFPVLLLLYGTALAQTGSPERSEVRLSPQVRSQPLEQVIPEIPRALIDHFQVDNLVIDPQQYEDAARIIGSVDDNLVIGAGDTVLARFGPGADIGTVRELEIIRMGDAYADPETGEPLGHQGLRIGTARMQNARADEALRRVQILRSRQEVLPGDRLMVRPEVPVATRFSPRPAAAGVEGQVLELLTELSRAAQYDSVLLSVGGRDGLEPGDLLTVLAADSPVTDPLTGETLVSAGEPVATLLV